MGLVAAGVSIATPVPSRLPRDGHLVIRYCAGDGGACISVLALIAYLVKYMSGTVFRRLCSPLAMYILSNILRASNSNASTPRSLVSSWPSTFLLNALQLVTFFAPFSMLWPSRLKLQYNLRS